MSYEFDPQLHLKLIVIVGLGGTGSQLARSVTRMVYDMRRRNMFTPDILFVDPDVVEEKNVGRQMFTAADVGQYKAEVLARRFNYALGLGIVWRTQPVTGDLLKDIKFSEHVSYRSNDVILCGAVDNHAARAELAQIPATWIDAGNHFSSGQVVIGNTSDAANIKRALEEATRRKSDTLMLCPNAALVFPELLQPETQPQPAVSCADLVAMGDQHLLINDAVAMVAAQYVFKLLFRQPITTFKTTISLDTLAMRSVSLTNEELSVYV